MTQEEYEFLINSLELDASIRPRRYKSRLTALAVLGYAYVIGIIALLVLSVVGLVYVIIAKHTAVALLIKLLIPLLALIYVVARAMWVTLDPPSGRVVTAKEFPKLFEVIEEVRRRAKAPRLHQVLMTSDFNAAVVQNPRLGFFGWQRNYLILGLPMMQGLTEQELVAVMAHEFGHLSGAHGHFGAWIYRLRAGWSRLVQQLSQESHWGSGLFTKFFEWYMPKFSAYSFVQARQQEYEADAISAAVTSPAAAGSALVRADMQGAFLSEKFWPAIFKRTHDTAEPSVAPYTLMHQMLRRPLPLEHAKRYLDDALKPRTGYADTHPSLKDRLNALGVAPTSTPFAGPTAAEALLGTGESALREEFDSRWRSDVKGWWKERHAEVAKSKVRFAELNGRVEALSLDDRFEHAQLVEELVGAEAGLKHFEIVLQTNPEHLLARFSRGRLKLALNDPEGTKDIEFVMSRDQSAIQPGCQLIVSHLRKQGQDHAARSYMTQYWKRQETLNAAEGERSQFRPEDEYLPHGLSGEVLQSLVTQLRRCERLKEAYLVRKGVKMLSEHACYALFVKSTTNVLLKSDNSAKEVVEEVGRMIRSELDIRIVSLESNGGAFVKNLKKVPGSLIVES